MNFLDRRFRFVAVLALAAGVVTVTAWRNRASSPSASRASSPTASVASPPGETGSSPSENHPTPQPQLPAQPAAPATPDRIQIEGSERTAIDSSELADRPTGLTANDRRAWRLSELIPDTYMHSNAVIHALTIDGGDYILKDDGRGGDDVLVVRRDSGELYIAWLDGNANDGRPLADAERPVERIEHIARIALVKPTRPVELPPAKLSVTVDGVPRQTLTAASFAAAARIALKGQHDGDARAIDVAHAFGAALEVAGLVADGAHVTTAAPGRDARPVIYLNRRGRFKFAWIDPSGEPIRDTKQREVSELALRSTSRLATRP
ncbi:MAG: hypothetical protein E6J90_21675 [Deltaproteobacteria bacterium]|nr:MAG: hypothetical protein E6J91_12530 [Deltaproteobacteria bacterium]TMQ17813.1 MAG: hypothetical protein E6J90_21675 [Deltaproteobacteria bacterium]